MKVEDYDQVVEVWKKAGIELSLSDEKPEFERMLKQNPKLCLVLEQQNTHRIVGAVLGGFDGRRGWVHHLAVLPEHQGKGFGKKIMDELVKRFCDMNVVKLKLEVVETNRDVVDFYKHLGWDERPEIITMSLSLRDSQNSPC